MRTRPKRALAVAAAVIGVLVIVVVALSSGGSDPRYGDRESSDERSSAPPRPNVRRFGQTVRLRTYLTVIDVRPLGFVRLAASSSSGAGVGVDLAIRNVGRAAYRDQPIQAASVTLRRGGEAERVYTPVGGCRALPPDTVRIPRGAVRRFCLPFEADGRPDLFVYAPELGLPGDRGAPEAAAWSFAR